MHDIPPKCRFHSTSCTVSKPRIPTNYVHQYPVHSPDDRSPSVSQSYMLQSIVSVWYVLICIFVLELLITPHFVILKSMSLCVRVRTRARVRACVQARVWYVSVTLCSRPIYQIPENMNCFIINELYVLEGIQLTPWCTVQQSLKYSINPPSFFEAKCSQQSTTGTPPPPQARKKPSTSVTVVIIHPYIGVLCT